MESIRIWNGSRVVLATRNDETYPWSARLYVNASGNNGVLIDGDATLLCATRKTKAGVEKWASRVLAA